MLAPMLRALAAAALAAALSGCAGIGQPAPYDSPGINGLVIPTPSADPADFADGVDNPWLPLEPGATWTYDVVDSGRGIGSIVVDVLQSSVPVGGLRATAVRTTTDLGDAGVGTATELFAQDEAGNVWLVGADGAGATWRAGEDGAQAGLAMPADPRLGDGWVTHRLPGRPAASTTIEEQTVERVQIRHEAGTTTRNVYEKGVGLVGFEDLDAGWSAERRS